jgi:hypothetical protein
VDEFGSTIAIANVSQRGGKIVDGVDEVNDDWEAEGSESGEANGDRGTRPDDENTEEELGVDKAERLMLLCDSGCCCCREE